MWTKLNTKILWRSSGIICSTRKLFDYHLLRGRTSNSLTTSVLVKLLLSNKRLWSIWNSSLEMYMPLFIHMQASVHNFFGMESRFMRDIRPVTFPMSFRGCLCTQNSYIIYHASNRGERVSNSGALSLFFIP